MKHVYRIGEVARRLHLSVEKVRDLEAEGALKAERSEGGHRLFRESDVAAYERKLEAGTRPRRTTRGAKPKPPPSQPRRAPPPPPSLDDDPDELHDFPPDQEEDWEEAEEDPPVVRPPSARPVPPRRPILPAVAATPQQAAHTAREAEAEARRLKDLKHFGMTAIPYDLPPAWRGTVVAELEAQVTSQRLPSWAPAHEQHNVVRGIVEAIVKRYRDKAATEAAEAAERERAEAAREAARRQAAEERQRAAADAERRIQELIDHGMRYLKDEIREWEVRDRWAIQAEVERQLKAEVATDWTEREVEDLVGDELDEWDEGDPED